MGELMAIRSDEWYIVDTFCYPQSSAMSDKSSKITAEERALFRKNVEGVTPLSNVERTQRLSKKSIPKRQDHRLTPRPTIDPEEYENYTFATERGTEWLSAEDAMSFSRNGIQGRFLQQMKRGQMQIEGQVDLHNMTVHQATQALSRFLSYSLARHYRWVLIIHGKGHLSQGTKPRLEKSSAPLFDGTIRSFGLP